MLAWATKVTKVKNGKNNLNAGVVLGFSPKNDKKSRPI